MWILTQNIIYYSTILVTTLVIILFFYYKNAFLYWKKNYVPFLAPRFPLGNLKPGFLATTSQIISEIFLKMKQKGVEFCGFYIFAMPVFMPVSPEMNKNILKKYFNHFNDRGFSFDENQDPMAASVLTFSGEKWRKMREQFSPNLTAVKIKSMFPLMQQCARELDELIEENMDRIDLLDFMRRFTVDIICLCGFGVEGNSLKDPKSIFYHQAKQVFAPTMTNALRLTICHSAPLISKTFGISLFDPNVTNFFKNIVHKTIDYREANNVVREDFINMMIQQKKDMSDENPNVNTQIAAQCFIFFVGGFESTSTTLLYALYELCLNADIQDKARDEVLNVLKKYNNELCYDALQDMRYLDNIVHETLRKYPIASMLNRTCTEDFHIPESNTVIKKGTNCIMSVLGMHHDAEFYPEPKKFDPKRFGDEEKEKRPACSFLGFGEGPRICPGRKLGTTVTKMGIVTILKNYKLSLHPSTDVPLETQSLGVLLLPKTNVLVKAEKI